MKFLSDPGLRDIEDKSRWSRPSLSGTRLKTIWFDLEIVITTIYTAPYA